MAIITIHPPWTFTFGLLGNIVSFMVYLAPLPTFYRVYRKKSTEGFQSLPYVVALFSAMMWIYYAFVKTDAYLLITINTIGCVIQTIYITIYITYAPKKAKLITAKLLLLLNVGVFCLILILTQVLVGGPQRVRVLGWVCVAFSVSVFAAPLSIMRLVIRTKSVEFMPFYLSFFLTLSAVMWFSYGFLLKDKFIALPNVVGFIFGLLQMILYMFYKGTKKEIQEQKLPEHIANVVRLSTIGSSEVHPIDVVPQTHNEKNMDEDVQSLERADQDKKDVGPTEEAQSSKCEV
ncbi:bidirectional sugar transporter SWEET14-like [Magnolia sinica]|uniref:bidirectional sugar transporter SWEET14-like n=1 Tax=Magnolia sinica TaxID=86752 RepID=UPI00265AC447|nr:bidirectional sugar transporter SWEET14-like [Magnolia sinica]